MRLISVLVSVFFSSGAELKWMLVLLLTDRSSASAINQACNTPLRQSKAKMLYVFFFLLSALFALIKFHKLYAKHYSVSPHSEESERESGMGWVLSADLAPAASTRIFLCNFQHLRTNLYCEDSSLSLSLNCF